MTSMVLDTLTPRPAAPRPRIALAHDWLVAYRGGEAVLEAIAATIRPCARAAGVYTMFLDPAAMDGFGKHPVWTDALTSICSRRVSPLNRLPRPLRRWLLPAYPWAVERLSARLAADHAREPIDLLISTSSAAIKGLRPPSGVPHLCYCHSPARYLWSQADEYARGRAGGLRALGLRAFGPRLRDWDRRTAAHVTTFLANSTHTAREIRRCYGRDAQVVFPPVSTDFFTPPPSNSPRDGGWLCVGALEPYKRVDLAIEAANLAGQRLTVVGDGSQSAHLRALAGPTVTFTGHLTGERLRDAYRRASLFLFPQIEDFGIVAVEAQACGTPVLAFRSGDRGGALDTVIDGVTGAFFDDPAPPALAAAAARVPSPGPATAAACKANAERFSEARFLEAITLILGATIRRSAARGGGSASPQA